MQNNVEVIEESLRKYRNHFFNFSNQLAEEADMSFGQAASLLLIYIREDVYKAQEEERESKPSERSLAAV